MLIALSITILPTLLASLLIKKIGLQPKSTYLSLAFAWFVGTFFFTMLTFLIATILALFTSAVLWKATLITLVFVVCLLIRFAKQVIQLFKTIRHKVTQSSFYQSWHMIMIIFCFLFPFLFFTPHLLTENNTIYTSEIYWDFHWHVGIIQNFVHGDNFPPQNEAMAGEPMTYHFFGDLVMAIYIAGGLSLTDAITFTSIMFLFFLFLSFIGLGQEFFRSTGLGFLAVILTATSSSGRFIYYFLDRTQQPLLQTLEEIFTTTQHPWYLSHIPGSPFNYVGTMFNLFYYLEERHMIIGFVYLLLSVWVIYIRKTISLRVLPLLGAAMGAFFFWHLYITAMIGVCLLFVLLFGDNKKKTLFILSGFIPVFGIQYIFVKYLIETSPAFIAGAADYPQINLGFAVHSGTQVIDRIFTEMVLFYLFGYGLKFFLIPAALLILWQRQKQLAVILTACILPIFILINIAQISPTAVHENHKFLLPLTVIANLAIAYLVFTLFFAQKHTARIFLGCLCVLLLTISGIIEHMPFINSQPDKVYANIAPSSLTTTIRNATEPQAVIVGKNTREIHLAGRKLFVGESAGPAPAIDTSAREATVTMLYEATAIAAVCDIVDRHSIDYIEYRTDSALYQQSLLDEFPRVNATDNTNATIIYSNVRDGCAIAQPQ